MNTNKLSEAIKAYTEDNEMYGREAELSAVDGRILVTLWRNKNCFPLVYRVPESKFISMAAKSQLPYWERTEFGVFLNEGACSCYAQN